MNDGNGNLVLPDFVEIKDPWPSDMDKETEEFFDWMNEHCEPSNRFLTTEDLIADQQATVTEKSKELLSDGIKQLGKHVNISMFRGVDPRPINETYVVERLDMDGWDHGVRELEKHVLQVLRISPKHTEALAVYGNMLHSFYDDKDGAEVMLKRAIEADPKHALSLASYASLLLDKREVEKARTMLERAVQADPSSQWIKTVAKDPRWKQSVRVKVSSSRIPSLCP
mmetsp:Transcript_22491/g.35196  ORF Transcript_22491/g.35196 Transcript_22491/m.35196 type:complete len:226 (+) Transcript_22491:181-858(+)